MERTVTLPCVCGDWLYHISGAKYRCIGFKYIFESEYEKEGWVVLIETENKLRHSAFMFEEMGRRWFLDEEEATQTKIDHYKGRSKK